MSSNVYLPNDVILHIFSFLKIEPKRRCFATTKNNKMCKQNKNSKRYKLSFFCKMHEKNQINIENNKECNNFTSTCILLHKKIKNNEKNLQNKKRQKKPQTQTSYYYNHSQYHYLNGFYEDE